MTSIPVLVSAQGLSADCSAPDKGRKVPMSKMDIEMALERLRSFGALSSIQLGESDASITLARGDLRLLVTNQGGRLMALDTREAEGLPVEKSPEEIGAWLMTSDGQKTTKRQFRAPTTGGALSSLAGEGKKLIFIGVMLIGTAVMAWVNFGPKGAPEGIVYIDHPVRIAGLNQIFTGSYGNLNDPSQVVFVVDETALKIHLISQGRMEPEPLRVMTFRYASRGLEELLIAENGAIIERDATGNLVYSGTTYPKIRS